MGSKYLEEKIKIKSNLTANLVQNEFFNIHFLKQCFYTKNILNCEVERDLPGKSTEERDAYSELIDKLREFKENDISLNQDILNFFYCMKNQAEGNFITKFYLFTTLLKNTFSTNPKLKEIQDQFSFEHLLREIYYSKSKLNSIGTSNQIDGMVIIPQDNKIENLDNNILSDLIKNYQPFEIVDGDSLRFSLDGHDLTLGDKFNKSIFIVSIVGPQSTGKSTIINNLFSVEFQTSQWRCSRGVNGVLIPIKENLR